MKKVKLFILVILSFCLVLSIGCTKNQEKETIYIFVAASLTDVMNEIIKEFTSETNIKVHLNLGGSQRLSTQIEEGIPAHLFISANLKLAEKLKEQKLIDDLVEVASNQVVFAVSSDNKTITGLDDLINENIKISIGTEDVPVGNYSREVLEKLEQTYGVGYKQNVLNNVVSIETDVKQIIARISTNQVDGGFVYKTDTLVTNPPLKYITVPTEAEIMAKYIMGITSNGKSSKGSEELYNFIISKKGQEIFKKYGFYTERN